MIAVIATTPRPASASGIEKEEHTMWTWLEAATYCEEELGTPVNTAEGWFICPDCGEPVYEEDWDRDWDWERCPICGFEFYI